METSLKLGGGTASRSYAPHVGPLKTLGRSPSAAAIAGEGADFSMSETHTNRAYCNQCGKLVLAVKETRANQVFLVKNCADCGRTECLVSGDATRYDAKQAGLAVGARGGILVNEFMQTSDPDIYAAGDCVEIPHLITGARVHAPYGDLANLEGRVVGQNVVNGPQVKFPGTLHTGVCKVFDRCAWASARSSFRWAPCESAWRTCRWTKVEIVCYCKISLRGYEAAGLLQAHGFTNVKVMEGGVMAWPFAREK